MKKRIIFFGILVLIVVGVIILRFWQSKNTLKNKGYETVKLNQETQMELLNKPNWKDNSLIILNYQWNLNSLNTSDMAKIFGIKNNEIDEGIWSRFVKYFRLGEEPIKNDNGLIAFGNKDESEVFYIDKIDKRLNYTKDILFKPITPGNNKLSTADLDNKVKMLLKNTVNLPEGLSLELVNSERVNKNLGYFSERMVIMEYEYVLNDQPIYSSLGWPLIARFYDDGTLLSFSMYLPFSENSKVKMYPLKNLEEVKKISGDQLKIISLENVDGTKIYNEDTIMIDSLNLNSVKLGYIYEPNNSFLQPVYVFEATGKIKDQNIKATVAALALKDNVYK